MQSLILRIALPNTKNGLFDYLPPQDIDYTQLKIGLRVRVPFRSRELTGLVIELATKSEIAIDKLKRAIAIIDQESILPPDLHKLCSWAADYYHAPLGDTLTQALPLALRKGLPIKPTELKPTTSASSPALPLNSAQQEALTALKEKGDAFNVFLLDGITGSGKTEVYLQYIEHKIKKNQQVLILLPEISLTPQTIERFAKRFTCHLATYHSNVSAKDKLAVWQHVKNGNIQIVIGTRSALFLPFSNLGLIIIDEEHDPSFKQQDRLRYHARDLAIVRAKFANIPVILGSATPSLETLLNAKRDRYTHLVLKERAGNALLPTTQLIDLTCTRTVQGIAEPLLAAIKTELESGNQVLLFLNRRGFAPITYCTRCKKVQTCHACDSKLVHHTNPDYLQCHHCEKKLPYPKPCEFCQENTLIPLGAGTQRLEETLRAEFPEIPIHRLDRDITSKKNTMQTILNAMHDGKPAILIGTQMLAKGHHFPHVTLVGIIDIDHGLLSTHFRAREHIGQLLLQVAGRAGRAEKRGTVYIQTLQPLHPILTLLTQHSYAAFADFLLKEREIAMLPPFSYCAVLSAEAKTAADAKTWLMSLKNLMKKNRDIILMGPSAANMAKRRGFYREQLIIQAAKRHELQNSLRELNKHLTKHAKKRIRYALDVDPIELD